ncbi:hypothetical protein TNCV_177721 [Trichonephila clavipes]|nr:hypothetical protein TNCV_177721 [Trichonephila clavipes]
MPDDHLYSLNIAPSFTICAVVARFPATRAGHFNGLWEVRCRKGQDEVLCVQHLSIPPYRDTPDITDFWAFIFSFISSVDTFKKSAGEITPREKFKYASTHHGAQQGEAARRSSDMRQARHLPQRWYWSIVIQVRDVIRQFTQGTPNCNTNPKATVFGIPKEPVLESAELITSRLTGAGSLLPPVYGEAWAKGHATGTPDSTFPRVCGGRVACVVGDGSKERSAESGPRGRGTWLRMARRRGLLHIEEFSLASALDRARKHVMGVSSVPSFEESSGGYTCTSEKCGNSWLGGGRDGTGSNPCQTNKGNNVLPLMETKKIFPLPFGCAKGAILPPVLKSFPSSWADRVESSTPSSGMDKTTFSSIEDNKRVPDTARYFIMQTTEIFPRCLRF